MGDSVDPEAPNSQHRPAPRSIVGWRLCLLVAFSCGANEGYGTCSLFVLGRRLVVALPPER